MLAKIKIYFLLFIIYSTMGWIMEVINQIINQKKIVNRGFLIGPYCPIYGCGAILITLLLNKYLDDWIVLFIMIVLLCGTLEYLTSYFMEKVFHLRWWDYSNEQFNINGRVCLKTIIPFGILGIMIMYITNPFLMKILNMLSIKALNIMSYGLMIIFFIDFIISIITIITIKKTTAFVSFENKKDNTEEITKKVKEILLEKPKDFAGKRLINAYPKLELIRIKVKKQIIKTKEDINQKIEDTKDLIDNKLDKTKEKINERINKRK